MFKKIIFAAAAISALTAGSVHAQNANYAGTWACQFSYSELTPQGGVASGFNREFMIAIDAGLGFQVQGMEMGVSGYSQFQSQGRLQGGPQGVFGQGPMMSNDPYAIPGMTFGFSAAMQADGTLASRYEQPDPNNQYVMNRSLTACRRAQGS